MPGCHAVPDPKLSPRWNLDFRVQETKSAQNTLVLFDPCLIYTISKAVPAYWLLPSTHQSRSWTSSYFRGFHQSLRTLTPFQTGKVGSCVEIQHQNVHYCFLHRQVPICPVLCLPITAPRLCTPPLTRPSGRRGISRGSKGRLASPEG